MPGYLRLTHHDERKHATEATPASPSALASPGVRPGAQNPGRSIASWRLVTPCTFVLTLLAGMLAACGSPDSPAPTATPIDDTPPTVTCAAAPEAIVIEDGWRFRLDPADEGEASGWTTPDFDDSAWDSIAPGAAWEDRGIGDADGGDSAGSADGAGWYRVTLTLPDWDAVYLVLSRVDDSVKVWVNGRAAGEWTLSARQAAAVNLRDYAAPGEPVTLALRVMDLGGYGGLIDPVRLARQPQQAFSPAQWVTALADSHPDWPMPGWTRGRPLAWTITGGIGLADEALVSADGAVAPWADAPTVEAWLADPETGDIVSGGGSGVTFALVEGDLPLPEWQWSALGVTVRARLFFDASTAALRWLLDVDTSAAERPLKLVIAARPFAANATAHPIRATSLIDPARLWLDGQPFMVAGQVPESAGVGTLDAVMAAAPSGSALVQQSLDCAPDGDGAALLVYALTPQAEPLALHFAFPGTPGDGFPRVDIDPQAALDSAVALWRAETGRMTIRLPDDRLTASIPASVGYLLLANDPDGLHPGSLAHDSVWVRDAAYTGLALLMSGHPDTARGYLPVIFAGQDANGRIAPILGDAIPWTDDEWDSQGQAIFLLTSIYRYTGDRALLEQWYPAARLAADYILTLREQNRDVAGPLRGLLPPSLSAEDLGPADQHYYWDNLWAVIGLDEAAYLARTLGEESDAARFSEDADDLRATILASVEAVMGPDAPYIPAAVEDLEGSGMARGSVPALWPERVFSPDLPLLVRAFDYYAQTWIAPYGGAFRHRQAQTWPYGGIDLAHAYLRLGRGDVLHQILGWTLSNQTLPGTFAWAEQVDPATGGFSGGDMPHAWAAGGWVTLVREMIVSERGDRLDLFTGAPEWWFEAGRVIALGDAPTPFGALSLATSSEVQLIDGAWQGVLTLTLDLVPGGAETLGAFEWRLPQSPAAVEGPPGTVIDGQTLVIPAAGTVRLTFGG